MRHLRAAHSAGQNRLRSFQRLLVLAELRVELNDLVLLASIAIAHIIAFGLLE
ncbi:hypothetical protein D3C87_2199960 [compost metagenome]